MTYGKVFVGVLALVIVAGLVVAGCGESKTEPKKSDKMPSPAAATGQAGEGKVAQKTCPIMGQPINKDIYVDYKGRRVYFCCQMCVETFKKEPEKYITKLDEQLKKAGKAAPEAGHEGHEH